MSEFIEDSVNNLGFHKFDFLTKKEIGELQNLYQAWFKQEVSGMAVSHNLGSPEVNLKISTAIHHVIDDALKTSFPNFDFFLSHFVVKQADNASSFQLHQDWNIVDESQADSFQIWIPLELSYPENGGMCFIPKSQNFNPQYRSGSFDIPRIKITPNLYPYLSYTRLVPGEAVAFSNNLLHGSFSNATPNDRVSVLVNVVQKGSKTIYFQQNIAKQKTEVYAIDAPLLLQNLSSFEKGGEPDLELLEERELLPFDNADLNENDLIQWIERERMAEGLLPDYEFKQGHIFKDSSLEHKVNKEGYAVLNLLGEEELEILRNAFDKYFPERDIYKGRYSSMDHKSDEERREIHHFIQKNIGKRLDLFFEDYYSPISILYSKRADGVSDTGWHSDPNFILNQHLEPLYAIWCPLVPVNQENGVLNVVPESHRFLDSLRQAKLPWELKHYQKGLDALGKSFELKPGEAIIYDARLIHSSPPNLSQKERDCFVMRIHKKGAKYFSFHLDDSENVSAKVYSQNEEFFYSSASINHLSKPTTGALEGEMYLFPEEVKAPVKKALS